ncbi:MAG TPA: hypothetical protein PL185_13240 [Flavobacteriales bacterium]|nr:hypothetical protein [Flavobacteriales bacterium]
MKKIYTFWVVIFALTVMSCQKEIITQNEASQTVQSTPHSKSLLFETMETGTKTAYTTGSVSLTSGSWTFNDALIGNSTSDRKNGAKSARVRNSGKLTMNFDRTTGAGDVIINHALYGTDAACTWQLYYSQNSGSTWTAFGSPVTTSSTSLTATTFKVNLGGSIRFDIRKTDASTNRINFDDISISDFSTTNPSPSLSSISPNTKVAGSAAFTLTVTGSNFVNGSTVTWNGTSLTTIFNNSTQLSATVSAALVATAGSASVAVVTPAPGGGTSTSASFTITTAPAGPKKFLFDNRHAEQAGNADWVLDQDASAARYPTPLQSNVTSSTSETYWRGAISAWGIALVKLGHAVETLPSTVSITYGNSSNTQDLSNYNVFVVDEPNTLFTSAEKTAILNFVQNGGSLMMISDHTISDRNNDGWDSPEIWNDLMTNNTVQNNPFGFSIDYTDISTTSTNVSTTTHPVLNGTQGTVTSVQFNNGATITINPTANPNVQGLVWNSSVTKNNNNLLCAVSTFGTGRVFVLGDSSPVDDGTGNSGNVLYNGWGVYSHSKLLLNASLWCAKLQ